MRYFAGGYQQNRPPFRPFLNMQRPLPGPLGNMTFEDFDGKRLRKSVMRKTVDYNSSIIKALEVFFVVLIGFSSSSNKIIFRQEYGKGIIEIEGPFNLMLCITLI